MTLQQLRYTIRDGRMQRNDFRPAGNLTELTLRVPKHMAEQHGLEVPAVINHPPHHPQRLYHGRSTLPFDVRRLQQRGPEILLALQVRLHALDPDVAVVRQGWVTGYCCGVTGMGHKMQSRQIKDRGCGHKYVVSLPEPRMVTDGKFISSITHLSALPSAPPSCLLVVVRELGLGNTCALGKREQ